MILIIPIAFLAIYVFICGTLEIKITNQEIKAKDFEFQAESLFRTVILFELIILVSTNILSFTKFITRAGVFIIWIFVLFLFVLLCSKNSIHAKKSYFGLGKDSVSWKKISVIGKIMLILMAVLMLVLLFGAIFTVPYNYDSMTYHLARIAHWIDNKSVAHYVTNSDRQLYSPVLAEYNLLHMMLLSGNDTFVNFLQYIGVFFAGFFIYKSARKLNTSKTFSVFATFSFMMMPLTISQSITTQNDLFVTVFFVMFVYKLIDVIKWDKIILDKEQNIAIISLGVLVAFAYLAKTSVCASMIFFMPWLLVARLKKKDDFKKLFGCVGIAIVSIVLPILETIIRTIKSAGSIMTDTASGDIMVATKNVKYIIVNILKNFSMLITQNYFRPLNGFIYRIPIGLAAKWQVEVNNNAIAFHEFDFLHHMNMGEDMYSHDKTPSAFVAYLAVVMGVLLLVYIGKAIIGRSKNKEDMFFQIGFAISSWLSLGFIMALLRWQPWGTRLMYPALSITVIASANMLSVFLESGNTSVKNIVKNSTLSILILLCTLLAVPSVTYNLQSATMFVSNGCNDRLSYYFSSNWRLPAYKELFNLAQEENVKDVGVIISGDGYDYPLWLVRKSYGDEIMTRQIPRGLVLFPSRNGEEQSIQDVSEIYALKDSDLVPPDAIFLIEVEKPEIGDCYTYQSVEYEVIFVDEETGDSYLQKK